MKIRKMAHSSLVAVSVMIAALITVTQSVAEITRLRADVWPKSIIAKPSSNFTALCRYQNDPLGYCRIEVPGIAPQNLQPTFAMAEGVKYFGRGLDQGECGVYVERVTDLTNGKLKCTMGLRNGPNEVYGEIDILIARPPRAPELDYSRGSERRNVYKAGEPLHVTCIVRDGRPAANLTWYLDDVQVYEGISNPTVTTSKEGLQTVSLNLSRILLPEDNERQLRCVSEHLALDTPNNRQASSIALNVKYPPLPLDTIDLFGFEIGKSGIIQVEIQANPQPNVEWTIGRTNPVRVPEGRADQNNRYEALSPESLGHGRYRVLLRIDEVTTEDTQTPFILKANNALGLQEYSVVISPNKEPQGLELGAGTIIALVALALIILLVIFIVVFARVTGRWCFSGTTAAPHTYESSDTESADNESQRKKRKYLLSKNFNLSLNLFGKKKDREGDADDDTRTEVTVASPQEIKDDDLEEESNGEGLVYAQLDLTQVDRNARPIVKTEDEKTEYAEIVYPKK